MGRPSKVKISGIYAIVNKINNKIYVGASNHVSNIHSSLRAMLRMGKHKTQSLQDDWNQYGEENFEFIVLEHVVNTTYGHGCYYERKQHYMDLYQSYEPEHGYNKCKRADTVGMTEYCIQRNKECRTGKKHSPETKQKMSQAKKGRKVSEETHLRIQEMMNDEEIRCKIYTEARNRKISEAKKGKKHSEEHRRKIAEGMKRTLHAKKQQSKTGGL